MLLVTVALCSIAGCSQQEADSNATRGTVIIRLSFEDAEGRRVLPERRLSPDDLRQKDRITKELDDLHRSIIVNRSGTARTETILTIRDPVTGKTQDLRSEIVQQVMNGRNTGLTELIVDGRKLRELSLVDGIPHGPEHQYWFTSRLAVSGSWKEGRKDGEWCAYYVNGKLGSRWHMNDGVAEGLAVAWSPEGEKLADGVYRGGSPYEGTFIDGLDAFERRVLVQAPSGVYMAAGTYKLVSYRRGTKTDEKPLDIPFSKSELDPWEELRAADKARNTSLNPGRTGRTP